MVVHRDRQLLLGLLLADHVLVEELANLDRFRQLHLRLGLVRLALLGDDVEADVHALVADIDGGPGDQLLDVALILVAETAPK